MPRSFPTRTTFSTTPTAARDNDPYNTLTRLNLGPLQPYTQFVIDGSRALNDRLRLGGSIWIRQLTNTEDTGPFDTSFQDFRANAQIFPWKKIDLFAGYHLRNADNRSERPAADGIRRPEHDGRDAGAGLQRGNRAQLHGWPPASAGRRILPAIEFRTINL